MTYFKYTFVILAVHLAVPGVSMAYLSRSAQDKICPAQCNSGQITGACSEYCARNLNAPETPDFTAYGHDTDKGGQASCGFNPSLPGCTKDSEMPDQTAYIDPDDAEKIRKGMGSVFESDTPPDASADASSDDYAEDYTAYDAG